MTPWKSLPFSSQWVIRSRRIMVLSHLAERSYLGITEAQTWKDKRTTHSTQDSSGETCFPVAWERGPRSSKPASEGLKTSGILHCGRWAEACRQLPGEDPKLSSHSGKCSHPQNFWITASEVLICWSFGFWGKGELLLLWGQWRLGFSSRESKP